MVTQQSGAGVTVKLPGVESKVLISAGIELCLR